MIDLLKIFVAVAGVLDLLLLLSLQSFFSIWAVAGEWIWTLISAEAKAYS
jgi:hypothetical protein